MNKKQLKEFRERYYWLTTEDIGEIAGVNEKTVEGWEQGEPIPKSCGMLINAYLMADIDRASSIAYIEISLITISPLSLRRFI